MGQSRALRFTAGNWATGVTNVVYGVVNDVNLSSAGIGFTHSKSVTPTRFPCCQPFASLLSAPCCMSEILVIGHRNPDTDAICSAVGYAEFKRRTGMPEAVAARCGDTNDRIDFVLNTFGVPAPKFVADVSPKVRDVMQARVMSVTPEATAAEALGLMDERNIRILPVLDTASVAAGCCRCSSSASFFSPRPTGWWIRGGCSRR